MKLNIQLQNFFNPPDDFSYKQQRYFVLLTVAGCAGILMHASYALLFTWMELDVLSIQSIIALFIWSVFIWLGRKGYIQLAILIAVVEFIVYVALGTYQIGWDSGIHYILFCAVMGILIVEKGQSKAFFVAVFFIEYVYLYFTSERLVWNENSLIINLFWLANVLTAFGFIFVYILYQTNLVESAESAMNKAFDQSEALLNNVMPSVIADRLKQSNEVIADSFSETSILFADIVEFTPLSKNMTPTEVVNLLNDLFSRIDPLVEKHKLEKIKTIGDAYMVAAGVPIRRSDHAEAIASFAIELQQLLIAFNHETGYDLQFRIGINSGPVVAGVIGKLRFLYDLWGDSVNTASRMESHGIPNEIQVTEGTHKLLLGKYRFEDRGVIDIKGKGPMRTYFLRV